MGGLNLHRQEHQSSSISCCLEDSRVSLSGDDILELPELDTHPQSHTTTDGTKLRGENIVANQEVFDCKICEVREQLNFSALCGLFQYWSTFHMGKYTYLKRIDQPFGLGIDDEGLRTYRRESEGTCFPLCEESEEEEELSPVERVFRRGLPEWTSDVSNYLSKVHPHRDCAIRLNLHGYLVLPVFNSFTKLCVGVLEFLTPSKYFDCAYEVQEVHRILKEANLTSPQAYTCPISYFEYPKRQHELDEIFNIIRDVCDTHKLPFAQTWTVSAKTSFVATERKIEMTCSSFNDSCIGEICLSTTDLPFYVPDLHFWNFREACRERHLLKSKGVVGRAFSSHGSCFCENITKLEDEYSLVYNARMSGLTSCFAIYMHSSEHDDGYVLEFFLPVDMKEGADLQNMVQMLKMQLKCCSFEFGGLMSTEVIEMPVEASQLSLIMQLPIISTSLSKEIELLVSIDSQTAGITNAQMDCINAKDSETVAETSAGIDCQVIQDQHDFDNSYLKNCNSAITCTEELAVENVLTKNKECNSVDTKAATKQRRKRKRDSLTREAIQKYFGKPIGEASKSLGVSRSTLKRVCRELQILSWPLPVRNKKYDFGISVVVFLLIRVKRWSCSSNRHGFSAKWWVCGRHNAFRSKLTQSAIMRDTISGPLYLPRPLKESHDSISKPDLCSKSVHARYGIYEATCLLMALKRWAKRTVERMRRMVTVKATYKDDMIKFQFSLSSGLVELKNQVAQRFKLQATKVQLKYRDEDDDLILISCDLDLHHLIPFSSILVGKNNVKLIVEIVAN